MGRQALGSPLSGWGGAGVPHSGKRGDRRTTVPMRLRPECCVHSLTHRDCTGATERGASRGRTGVESSMRAQA